MMLMMMMMTMTTMMTMMLMMTMTIMMGAPRAPRDSQGPLRSRLGHLDALGGPPRGRSKVLLAPPGCC